jgi:hypothetical protein
MIEAIQYITEEEKAVVFMDGNSYSNAKDVACLLQEQGYTAHIEAWDKTGIIVKGVAQGSLDSILRNNFEFRTYSDHTNDDTHLYTPEPRSDRQATQQYSQASLL